ncbi:hypothetical protein ACFQ7W_02720 [Streptomyces niveus]
MTNAIDGARRVHGAMLDWLLAEHRRAEEFISSRPLIDVMRQ